MNVTIFPRYSFGATQYTLDAFATFANDAVRKVPWEEMFGEGDTDSFQPLFCPMTSL